MSVLDTVKEMLNKVEAKVEEEVVAIAEEVKAEIVEIKEEVKVVKNALHEYHENKVKPQNDPQV